MAPFILKAAFLFGSLIAPLIAAGSAVAADARPLSVTVTSDAERTFDLSVGAEAPMWWLPSVGTTVGFEVAARQSPAAGRARAPGDPSGTVWGVVTLPEQDGDIGWDTTTIRVQVNPDTRERSVSFSGSKTWTLGKVVSASLEGTYTLTHEDDTVAPEWEAVNAVRFDFEPTGTAVVAQNHRSRDDGEWHTSLRAEQAVADGFSIAASVDNLTSAAPVKTIFASFSQEW